MLLQASLLTHDAQIKSFIFKVARLVPLSPSPPSPASPLLREGEENTTSHRGFPLDVSRNLPQDGQNFRTMSGNRVPKRKILSDIPIPQNGRSKFSPDVVSFYAEKILFVIVGKIFEHI